MIEKKSAKGNIDSKRSTYIAIGFVLAFGLTYACFELFATTDKVEEVGMADEEVITVMDETVVATDRTPPPPPPPASTTEIIFKQIDNEIEVETNISFEEFTDDIVIDEPVMVEIIEEEESAAPIMRFVENMPEFPGGIEKLYEYLGNNLRYPIDAKEAGIYGVVQVEFVVETDGRVSNVKPLLSVYPSLDEEAVRVVQSLPKWKPAEQMGKKVRCYYQIPIRFSIE